MDKEDIYVYVTNDGSKFILHVETEGEFNSPSNHGEDFFKEAERISWEEFSRFPYLNVTVEIGEAYRRISLNPSKEKSKEEFFTETEEYQIEDSGQQCVKFAFIYETYPLVAEIEDYYKWYLVLYIKILGSCCATETTKRITEVLEQRREDLSQRLREESGLTEKQIYIAIDKVGELTTNSSRCSCKHVMRFNLRDGSPDPVYMIYTE